jgi:malonate transporter and related proteins
MLQPFLALAPIFLVIAIGWAAKSFWLREDGLWRPIEQLAYYLLIPAFVVHDLYNADLASLPFSRMVIALLGAVLIVAALLIALRPFLSRFLVQGDAGFTSVFQGSTRANFFITLAAAPVLLPADGAALAIIAVAFFTVLVNVLSVLVLARWGTQGEADLGQLARKLITNPFILAAAAGLLLNVSDIAIPRVIDSTVGLLAGAGVPVALLTAGAGLRLASIGVHLPGMLAASLAKLVLMPVIAVGLGLLLGLEASILALLVLFHSQPTATTSYVLARQMGGDHELMAATLTCQTLIAILTVPAMLAFFA